MIQSLTVITLLFVLLANPIKVVSADATVTTADMISLINGWRTATYGYPALVENSYLNSCAQWTANEMASTHASTHLALLGYSSASDRCAQIGFGSGKTVHVTENFVYDKNLTLSALTGYWSDSAHMLPASSAQYLYVGAGIASSDSGETYYVLEAGSISGESAATSSSGAITSPNTSTDPSATTDTSQSINPVITSTPNFDGVIYHTVKSGQTLFDIALAYDVTVNYLQEQNSITDYTIYVGQSLKIKLAPTPTVTSTFTPTVVYPTRTPTVRPPTKTPAPVLTATPTPEPSMLDKLQGNRPTIGMVLLILSGLGLLAVIFFAFIKPANPSAAPMSIPEPQPVLAPEKPKRKPKAGSEPAPKVETEVKKASVAVKTELPKAKTSKKAPAPVKPTDSKSAPETASAEPVKKKRTVKKKTEDSKS
jgi:LysM repeat protein